MAHADDYTNNFPPWGKRQHIVPLRTYSGKVVYNRPPHRWTERDIARVMAKVSPPDNADDDWYEKVIMALRQATLEMLQRILPFLQEGEVVALYDWAYDLVEAVVLQAGLDDATIRKYLYGLQGRLKGL